MVTLAPQQTPFGVFLDAETAVNVLAEMKSANVTWIHPTFSWSAIEPRVGQRNWGAVSGFESILRTAASQQINAIIYLQGTPNWARKAGYSCGGAVAPDKLQDLGRFLTDLVARYSAPPFNVQYYELWNEQEVSGFLGCWGDPSDPTYYGGGYYGEMLKTAYPAIKAASPSAQVLFGGLLMDCKPEICSDDVKNRSHFLEGALVNGAGGSFDGVSFHAYDYYQGVLGQYSNSNWGTAWNTTGPVLLAKAAYLRQLLAQYHVSGKYLMNT